MLKGRYIARFAERDEDLRAAQRLRWLCFLSQQMPGTVAVEALDRDGHDNLCQHVLVEDRDSGTLVCCFRILPLQNGTDIARSYSAQYYNLAALAGYQEKLVELGRFCVHPDWRDPDILRCGWAFLADYVETQGIALLFGCSSFAGTDPALYTEAFTMLRERHLAPKRWLPGIKSPQVFRFGQVLRQRHADLQKALSVMPPLLRSYLAMGGWVSDHAVVDPHLNTLHVFTGLEVSAIPPVRRRLLRAVTA